MPIQTDAHGREVVPLLIHGKISPIDENRLVPVLSGSSKHFFQNADLRDCNEASNSARSAFRAWKRSSVIARRQVLDRFLNLLQERKNDLVECSTVETGFGEHFVHFQIEAIQQAVTEISAALSELRGAIPPNDTEGEMTFIFREPVGPVLVIAPWNAPFFLAARAIAGVVASGCTIVFKASERSPRSHQLVVDLFNDAGCPPGVINFVAASRDNALEISEALIGHESIRKIEFIGSSAVGSILAGLAAKYSKPILMELGGKNAAIILDDADLDSAATFAAQGAIMHQGQICVGTDRIIFQRKVAKDFIAKLVNAFQAAEPMAGTAISPDITSHATEFLKDAKDCGVEFLYGSPRSITKTTSKPCLLRIDADIEPERIRIIDEETFGPSAAVYVVDTEQAAIDLTNRSKYGLSAAVHTRDLARGLRVGRELDVGQVVLNNMTIKHNMYAPFGGQKASGNGRSHGIWQLQSYSVERTITWSPPLEAPTKLPHTNGVNHSTTSDSDSTNTEA